MNWFWFAITWLVLSFAVAGAYVFGVGVGRRNAHEEHLRVRRLTTERRTVAHPGTTPSSVREMRIERDSQISDS
jgi:hypothetical protein